MHTLLIQHCHVLQTTSDGRASVLPDHEIVVTGSQIAAVQPSGTADPHTFDTVIDAAGQVAMPGLINCHAHVPMVLWRGLAEDVSANAWFNDYIWLLEANLEPEDVYWGTLLGQAEMIEGGVTAVADHYFHMDEAARATAECGARALLGWCIFSSSGEALIERTADWVTRWQGAADGRIRTWMAPHAPYTCDDSYLRATAYRARTLGVGIHIHAAEMREQTEFSLARRGQTPLEVLEETGVLSVPTILAHVIGATDDDIARLARRPVGIAHAPKTYLKLAMGTAPVRQFRAAGIPVGLATDGAVSSNTLDLWEALRLLALTQKDAAHDAEVLTVGEALTIATRESAQVFGLGDTLGVLEPGRLADIILVDVSGTHHQPLYDIPTTLVYNTRASDVQTTIIDGRLVMHQRRLLTIDKAHVIAQVRDRMARLRRRDPRSRIQDYAP